MRVAMAMTSGGIEEGGCAILILELIIYREI